MPQCACTSLLSLNHVQWEYSLKQAEHLEYGIGLLILIEEECA
ncbi:hypothetical protein CLOBOL_00891 [Enterocloster bolteae ATCC BAA-613]|uniref:Uncharacterized protein n=1 Tax=Enterocloster bolteae (strain ATCC BAA-613 / DSM 15670 / CCUG 46953 / JCM 12243 / WAL 16351) TaxID=411902 RepID=A8RJE3_ENTBW|nr:hypothetical protein CLOBOL_00891 [Enterocloster bolteae ATCC BAA-613]